MNRFVAFIAATVLGFGVAVHASAGELSLPTLAAWRPISVTKQDGALTVVLPEDQVTPEVYQNAVGAICMALFTDSTVLDGIQELRVLNRHSVRGFVAEGGKDLCLGLNDQPAGQSKSVTLLAVTHTY